MKKPIGQGILHAPLGFVTAVPHKREVSILGRGQGVEHCLAPPFHQQMHMPIVRLAQAAKAPGHDLGRGPTGECFQGFVAREESLHANQPTQHEAVTTFPEAGHPTKQHGDEQGHIGDLTIAYSAVQGVEVAKNRAFLGCHGITLPLVS
jgi:hypothetical protein